MSAQRAIPIANDNLPGEVRPVVAPTPRSIPMTAAPTAAPRASGPDPIRLVLLIWSIVGAAAALMWPLGVSIPALCGLGAAAVLAAMSAGARSTATLALSCIVLAGGTIAALATTTSALPLLALGLWSGGVWMIQSTLAVRLRSNEVALVATASLIAVGLYLLGTVETALGVLPVIASVGLIMLGMARLGTQASTPTADVHYGVWWAVVAGCAVVVQQLYPDLPAPSQAVSVAAAVMAAGAAFAWSMGRARDTVTGLAIIAAFAMIYNAGFTGMVEGQSLMSPAQFVPAIFGAAVFAAGLAMCVRGLKRGDTVTMLLGAGAMLIEALLVGRGAMAEPEVAALTVLLAGVFATYLAAIRS